MPDIREVLNALDEQDKKLWRQHRTEIRRSYMTAHNTVNGVVNWSDADDAFIDLIDIQLALLFDRAGRLAATKDIVGTDGSKIIDKIEADGKGLKLVNQASGWLKADDYDRMA